MKKLNKIIIEQLEKVFISLDAKGNKRIFGRDFIMR